MNFIGFAPFVFVSKKRKLKMPPNSADIYFFQSLKVKAKKIFMEGFILFSLFTFNGFYYID